MQVFEIVLRAIMQIRIAAAYAVLICSAAFAASADAQHYREPHEREWHGDIHRFHEHDIVRWRAGHWMRTRHGGRLGWWWVVDGLYYAYPAPIYPYPDPYTPPVVATPGPPPVAPAPGQPGTWYYCDSPRGYYPYVPQCQAAWRPVPASPPPG